MCYQRGHRNMADLQFPVLFSQISMRLMRLYRRYIIQHATDSFSQIFCLDSLYLLLTDE